MNGLKNELTPSRQAAKEIVRSEFCHRSLSTIPRLHAMTYWQARVLALGTVLGRHSRIAVRHSLTYDAAVADRRCLRSIRRRLDIGYSRISADRAAAGLFFFFAPLRLGVSPFFAEQRGGSVGLLQLEAAENESRKLTIRYRLERPD